MSYPTKAELTALAYKMKKETGLKLGQCYEQIAKQQGFKTYAAMRAALKQIGELK